MSDQFRLRAAPSPTGRVHIGNLRTFLYNYLFVKQQGGKFILRVEDTDQKRKVEGGTEAIIEVLSLYGIEFDEGPVQGGEYGSYIQTERLDLYQQYADQLIESGHAYRCFCSEERLAQLREDQAAAGRETGYDRRCRNLTPEEVEGKLNAGEKYVIRAKFPTEGITEFDELVYGHMKVRNDTIDDWVMIKSDGIPTYHYAVVIDDHFMEITHVVRGREYLADTPKNIHLYNALGWEIPQFIHVPHILKPPGQGKGKLGKRDGALPAIGYLKKGYLPEAVLNYIALIGWSPDPAKAKQSEVYSMNELIELFQFEGISKTGGRYDPKKLDSTSGKHIRLLNEEELAERVIDWVENIALKELDADKFEEKDDWQVELEQELAQIIGAWKGDRAKFVAALGLVHERLEYFAELPRLLKFLYTDQLTWSDEDWRLNNHDKAETAAALEGILPEMDRLFESGESVSHEAWEQVVRGYADKLEWKHGDMFMALRSAITGKLQSPPILESVEVMGWEKARKFVEQGVEWLRS